MEFMPVLSAIGNVRNETLRLVGIAERLLNHLINNYSGVANDVLNTKNFKKILVFQSLKKENRDLAYDICNNYYEKEFEEFIQNVFKKFLRKHLNENRDSFRDADSLEDAINRDAELSFHRMPRSIESFSDYLAKNHPVFQSRLFLRKLVQNVLEKHAEGFCWNGEWDLQNWEIINGIHMQLDIDPIKREGRVGSHRDLNQIAKVVIPQFRFIGIVAGEEMQLYPAYLEHLLEELSPRAEVDPNNPGKPVPQNGDNLSDAVYFHGWYYQFLMYHPGLLSAKARKNLLYGIYDSVFHLQCKRRAPYSAVFDNYLYVWTSFMQGPHHRILQQVYQHDPKAVLHNVANLGQNQAAGQTSFYENYTSDLLKFLRHLIEHAYDHTLWGMYFTQAIKNGNETELLAAHHFPHFFPHLLKMMLNGGCMIGDILEHWKLYMAASEAEV